MSSFEPASFCTLSEFQAWEPSRVQEHNLRPQATHMAMFLLDASTDKPVIRYPSRIIDVESRPNGLHIVGFALLSGSGTTDAMIGFKFQDGYGVESVVPKQPFKWGGDHVQNMYFRGEDDVFAQPWLELGTTLVVPSSTDTSV